MAVTAAPMADVRRMLIMSFPGFSMRSLRDAWSGARLPTPRSGVSHTLSDRS
ncbi:hypothetical protein P376_2728 [Streptomyces sp. HCCB10043]|nr:hypothetical protein P376_2728 [Streptomyces sp. HCCB10043]